MHTPLIATALLTSTALLTPTLVRATTAAAPAATASAAAAQPACTQAQRERIERRRAAANAAPDVPALRFFLASALVGCDAPAAAQELARLHAAAEGFLPSPAAAAFTSQVLAQADMAAQVATMEAALPRITAASVFARFDDAGLIPEGIAWDAARQQLFMGSMARGQVLVRSASGQVRVFAQGLPPVVGMALDPRSERLFAVTSNAIRDAQAPSSEVRVWDAASGKALALVAGAGRSWNDLAVARDGRVFISDSRDGSLWLWPPGSDAVRPLLPAGTLYGSNGLALSADERLLYVAHALGIAAVDAQSGAVKAEWLAGTAAHNTGAIDGLYRHGDWLIGVQNTTHPARVLALRLGADGSSVTSVRTLLSHHHPDLNEPTTGAIAGAQFLLLANSYIARLKPDGHIEDAASVRPPTVLAMPLPNDAR